MISPYFEELSTKHPGATFIKVDVDAVEVRSTTSLPAHIFSKDSSAHCCILQAVAQECGISAMPTFQVWKGGQKVDELVGASKDKLNALVEKHV